MSDLYTIIWSPSKNVTCVRRALQIGGYITSNVLYRQLDKDAALRIANLLNAQKGALGEFCIAPEKHTTEELVL